MIKKTSTKKQKNNKSQEKNFIICKKIIKLSKLNNYNTRVNDINNYHI